MPIRLISLALAISAVSTAPPSRRTQVAAPITAATSNRAIVDKAFAGWQAGRTSFYDLLIDGGTVTIAGQSPHSGTFTKADFLRDRAKPFAARFTTAILPVRWTIWAINDEIIVRWDSRATACDGKPYINSYAYFITMKKGRATALTMFLDMGAFDDVWTRCQPAATGADTRR